MRHAAHGLLPHTLAGRMPGVSLNEVGRAQALGLADWFAEQAAGMAMLVSSPVQRAQETAAAIGRRIGREVQTDDAWNEIEFGGWTGRTFEALATDPAWCRWNAVRGLAEPPGGEAMHAAQSRALIGLERLRAACAGRAAIVVSHSDVLKSVLTAALGMSLDGLHRFRIDPASVSTIVFYESGIEVVSLNRTVPPAAV